MTDAIVEKKLSITELLSDPQKHVDADQCALFYDWFCADSGLKKRAFKVIKNLEFLVEKGLINGDTHYVWFKNNCPMSGNTYDDLRINRIEDDEFLGGFCFASGHTAEVNKSNLWLLGVDTGDAVEGESETEANKRKLGHVLFEYKNWRSMKAALKSDQVLREQIKAQYS